MKNRQLLFWASVMLSLVAVASSALAQRYLGAEGDSFGDSKERLKGI